LVAVPVIKFGCLTGSTVTKLSGVFVRFFVRRFIEVTSAYENEVLFCQRNGETIQLKMKWLKRLI
jgi:hypothetical protein